ncbi:MAG: 2-C-methyl-D-erythritol 4-phosphate cytidylyltransferase [Deltaproteobacteria bacterium]|nr:2-C-methyl-D-erythritol 4-phosphate cytidylyltransferase [Deltaproteobacteria bacterium]
MNVSAIVVAAGSGSRVGGELPKVYLPLCGRELLRRTLDRVFAVKRITRAIVVVAAGELSRAESMLRQDANLAARPWVLQTGGTLRQDSVRNGLAKLDGDVDIVAIHDGARPFVSPALFERCIDAAQKHGAVVPGSVPRDTIKFVNAEGRVQSTPPRNTLREVQTPQVFRRELIDEAHSRAARAGFQATDDAMLVEWMGQPVYVIEGERLNFKVTLPEDVWLAETLIRDGKV